MIRHLTYLVLLASALLTAAAPDTITLVTRNFPPGWISDGHYAGKGFLQKGLAMVKKELPEYVHLTEDMSNERMLFLLKNGKKYCRGSLKKTPDNIKIADFSISSIIYPSVRLYFRKADADRFKKFITAGKISLDRIMQDNNYSLGRETIRNYDDITNAIIKKHAPGANIVYRISTDAEALVKMLIASRFDYILEYPYTVSFVLKSQKLPLDELISVPVAEIREQFQLAHIAVPKNQWGHKVLADINRVLIKLKKSPEYKALLEEWLPAEDLPAYREYYDKVFINSR